MSLLRRAWYCWIDRELDRPVAFPDRDAMGTGEWNAFVGATGERLASKRLWRSGRKVLCRNYRPEGGGEVDLVYRDGETLVFGEVKTASFGEFGEPGRRVDRAKEKLVIRGANAWLRELGNPEVLFRFDVIEVLLREGEAPAIRVNEGAFTTPQTGLGM